MHRELQMLFEQEQADREDGVQLDAMRQQWMLQRARTRRQRVAELLASHPLLDAYDYFHAAMIFQHGETPEHFFLAHTLAYQGAKRGHAACFCLMAAAYDRVLMSQGRPQKYGTQYIMRHGRRILYDVDPSTTDAQRAEWHVPPLAQCLQKAEEMNQAIFSVASQ
jgi:hypothetical protein